MVCDPTICSCAFCSTVSSDEIAIVERWGKFAFIAPPGLLCLPIPCMLQRVGTLSTRQVNLPVQVECKTKDDVFVTIRMEVQLVLDKVHAYAAYYRLTNVERQIRSYVADVTRSTICTRMLDEVYNDRDVLILNVRQRLTRVMQDYGYLLVAVLVNEVAPAEKVFRAMNQIESFRRLRHATVDQAEAEKNMTIKRAEGESERKRLQGVGTSRQRAALLRGIEMNMHHFVQGENDEEKNQEVNAQEAKELYDKLHHLSPEQSPSMAAIPFDSNAAKEGFARNMRGTMELRTDKLNEVAATAYDRPAHLMRMPGDVGVVDVDSLFPEAARGFPPHLRSKMPTNITGFTARDVMELILITNYFDMLKEVGANDSASTIYIGNSPGLIPSLRQEISRTFALDI